MVVAHEVDARPTGRNLAFHRERPQDSVYGEPANRLLLEIEQMAQRREEDAGRLARPSRRDLGPGNRIGGRVAIQVACMTGLERLSEEESLAVATQLVAS